MSKTDSTALVEPKKATQGDLIRAYLETRRGAMLTKLADLAEQGDARSLQIALSYLSPVARPDSERVVIPGFKDAKTLTEKAEAVIAAIATGHCSAEAGERLLRVLDVFSRAIVADDHEKRLAAIEAGKKPVALVERIEPEPTLEQRLAAIETDRFDDLA